MTSKKPVPKKSHQQQISIKERRKRVHHYHLAGKTYREIADIVGVHLDTVVQDMKAINRELAKEYEDIKPADLASLDMRLGEALGEFKKWANRADELWEMGDGDHGYPKGLGDAVKAAVSWHRQIKDVLALKGKWLGHEVVEKEPTQEYQDNRSVTININDPKSGEKLGFDDWVEGIFKPQNELNGPSST